MTDEVMRYLDKADHALVVAQDLLEKGHALCDLCGQAFCCFPQKISMPL